MFLIILGVLSFLVFFLSLFRVPSQRTVVLEWAVWIPGFLRPAHPDHVIARDDEQGVEARHYMPGWNLAPFVRVFGKLHRFPFITIPDDQIMVVTAADGELKWPGSVFGLPVSVDCLIDGEQFLREHGQRGPQFWVMGPGGTRAFNHFLFRHTFVQRTDFLPIEIDDPGNPGKKVSVPTFGLITALVGEEIVEGAGERLLGRPVDGHNNFQGVQAFLEGGGQRGPQQAIVEAATFLHPLAFKAEPHPATVIPAGFVGVRISNIGESPEVGDFLGPGDVRLSGRVPVQVLAESSVDGKRGIRPDSYGPGIRNISPWVEQIVLVDITPVKVCFHNGAVAGVNPEAKRSPIRRVRTRDGFEVTLNIEVIMRIPKPLAPMFTDDSKNINEGIREFVAPVTERIAREVSANGEAEEMIAEQGRLGENIKNQLTPELDRHFIELIGVNIVEIEFEDEAIKARVKATTDLATLAAREPVERRRKKIERLKGEADAEAGARVIARTAEARKKALDRLLPNDSIAKTIAGAVLADPEGLSDALRGKK